MLKQQREKTISVYHAAALFNLADRLSNHSLVEKLEANGIKVFSPQRDGFEFSQLVKNLKSYLPEEKKDLALNVLIYTYDIQAVSQSDAVIARVDEPLDPGVDTEVLVANALGIPVIAYRTDVRSPYGAYSGRFGGMHSFPVKAAQSIIIQEPSLSPEEDFQALSDTILDQTKVVTLKKDSRQMIVPGFLSPAFKIAELLFKGIQDLHSPKGLEKLGRRCVKYDAVLRKFGPTAVRLLKKSTA